MQATGNEPSAKLLWLKRLFAKFEGELGGLRRSELRALEMKVGMMEENEILARQMAAAAAEHAARDEALERRLAEAEAALERFQLAAEAQAEAQAVAQAEAQWVAIASSPDAAAALARAEAVHATTQAEAASSTAGGDAALGAEAEAASTPEPSAQLEASGASTETDAAATAAPAAFAPEGSTGGASRPRDHEGVSPNKNPLKKLSVVKHSASDPTKQHLAFGAPAAAE
jgi:hypothetical protein